MLKSGMEIYLADLILTGQLNLRTVEQKQSNWKLVGPFLDKSTAQLMMELFDNCPVMKEVGILWITALSGGVGMIGLTGGTILIPLGGHRGKLNSKPMRVSNSSINGIISGATNTKLFF